MDPVPLHLDDMESRSNGRIARGRGVVHHGDSIVPPRPDGILYSLESGMSKCPLRVLCHERRHEYWRRVPPDEPRYPGLAAPISGIGGRGPAVEVRRQMIAEVSRVVAGTV